jgi:hypothetical protein
MDSLILEKLKLLLEKEPSDSGDPFEDDDSKSDGPDTGAKDPFDDSSGDSKEGGEEKNDSQGSPIALFSEKTNLIKKIKFQRIDAEPDFDFSQDGKFFYENYVGVSENGSLIIATPKFQSVEDYQDSDFFKNSVLYRIYKCAKNASENGKKIVFMGDYGLPVYETNFQNSEQGIIAKFLLDKFGNKVSFDTWIPQEYSSFMAKTSIWNQLKSETESGGSQIKAAVYLYLILWHGNNKLTDKLCDDKVKQVIAEWGIKDYITTDIDYGDNKNIILKFLYPELDRKPDNEASYIIKMYYHLLLKDLIISILKYERSNKIVIAATSKDVAWALVPSIKNLNVMTSTKSNSDKEQ